MRRPALAVLALLAIALAGCGNQPVAEPDSPVSEAAGASSTASTAAASTTPATAEPFTMVGSISLSDNFVNSASGVGCQGSGGYSDITPGAVVTVYDASTAIVAVGSITIGGSTGTTCDLFFEVTDIPPSDFYQVEVSNRGLVTFTEAQARGGEVMLTLG